jgi:hypothetical protein
MRAEIEILDLLSALRTDVVPEDTNVVRLPLRRPIRLVPIHNANHRASTFLNGAVRVASRAGEGKLLVSH